MTTKHFIKLTVFFAAALITGLLLNSLGGCSKANTPINVSISLQDSAYAPLNNQSGGYVYIDPSGVSIIVVRVASGGASNPFIAVSSACTKDQCTVAYVKTVGGLQCPCCLSIYKNDGSVASGPAPSGLTQYTVKVKGDSLNIASM